MHILIQKEVVTIGSASRWGWWWLWWFSPEWLSSSYPWS